MYQITGQGAGVLATTGLALASGWVAAWTLVVAGVAAWSVVRVLRRKAVGRTGCTR
ncbi:thaumatin family protein [Cellulosimicrobium cellulans]|uniref:thaumatin family protein n=1 Tax=Cellulosimicrobium cellulans TaxID=1710 RepID=UPI00130DB384|nr:thaumatin family protein [Cellulosimicrobium cellulans]